MDWTLAIERNRAALLRIVAVLFVYAGLDEGGAETLPRRVWRKILVVLRPAESAVRRLIVVTARNIEIEPSKPRAARPPSAAEQLQAAGLLVIHQGFNFGLASAPRSEASAAPAKSTPTIPAFPLADPPRRFDARAWNGARPFPRDGFELADADEEVKAARLCRRLHALKNALDDLDGHALRLARWRARRALHLPSSSGLTRGSMRASPLRLGHPPGHRRRPAHPVADILRECHDLALSLPRLRPDTS